MTQIEFSPYSNHHLRFKLSDGRELSGVLLVPTDESMRTKVANGIYDFIPTWKMIDYKLAEQNKNTEKMNSLKQEINIANIVWADRLKY